MGELSFGRIPPKGLKIITGSFIMPTTQFGTTVVNLGARPQYLVTSSTSNLPLSGIAVGSYPTTGGGTQIASCYIGSLEARATVTDTGFSAMWNGSYTTTEKTVYYLAFV